MVFTSPTSLHMLLSVLIPSPTPGKTSLCKAPLGSSLAPFQRVTMATYHVLNLRKCNLQGDIQDFICIFYRTKSIGIIFKKIIKQFLSIFSICCFYRCSKRGTWINIQSRMYFKAKNKLRTRTEQDLTSASDKLWVGELFFCPVNKRHKHFLVSKAFVLFAGPLPPKKRPLSEPRWLHTHQPLTSQSGDSEVNPAKGEAGMGPVHLFPETLEIPSQVAVFHFPR